tara:strand:+ start:1210 stop:1740 length:531 start_codon:yes stop_codon:yes gene_type:complete
MENKTKEITKLIIALIILLSILGGFILYVSFPLLSQTEVILSTQPVDPFDPIRGQYMTIGYEINRIPEIDNVKIGDTIYIILEEDEEGISRHKESLLTKPKEGIFIKGKVESISGENMRVEYGIEQYFFERGAKFETRINNVKIKLSEFGGARIVKVLDENKKPVKITYKNKTLTS